ncbi:MAG: DUF1499 domain-containing protein [Maritimibacter sp.]
MKLILLFLLVLLGMAFAYVRLAPLPQSRLTAKPGPNEPGRHVMLGGVKVVVPLADLVETPLQTLTEIALATPRTTQIGTDPLAFVTRSRLWGFPDIATTWEADGNLHIYSHLIFGKGDLGVNAAKVDAWLAPLTRNAQ